MAGSDNERTFVPAELDAIEDALELSSTADLIIPAGFDDDARARIHASLVRYRAIEQNARALLRVEPPAALLADVIAQARAAVALPTPNVPSQPSQPIIEARPSVWSKLKARWYVPALATIGSAAIVAVIVVQPRTEDVADERSANKPTMIAKAEAPPVSTTAKDSPALAIASDAKQAPAEEEQRGEGLLERSPTNAVAAETVDAELDRAGRGQSLRRDAPPADPAPRPEPAKPRASGGAAGPSAAPGGVPSPKSPATPTPAPKPTTKSEPKNDDESAEGGLSAQERLTRADDARRRGDCSTARVDYDDVVETGTAKQRARARAGIALCLERAGDNSGAQSLIDRAREDDATIDAWVATQR